MTRAQLEVSNSTRLDMAKSLQLLAKLLLETANVSPKMIRNLTRRSFSSTKKTNANPRV